MGWRTARHGRWLVLAALLCGLLACSGSKESVDSPPGTATGTGTEEPYSTCFVAGTEVRTPDGSVAIEDLSVGDAVLSWSVDAGALVERRVTHTLVRDTSAVWTLDLGDRQIEVTDEHPFWSLSEQRWVPVRELVPGDALAELRGERLVPVTLRAMVRKPRTVPVYNLTVQGPEHDYFAGGVLVHNKQGLVITVWWDNTDDADPEDTDGDGLPDQNCGDSVSIYISDDFGWPDWLFGMAESGPDGWTGEDCFNGAGTAYQFCHPMGISHTLQQVTSCRPEDVVAGSTTLLDASKEPYLTYYLEDDGRGDCFVFGADPAYYASLGCTEVM